MGQSRGGHRRQSGVSHARAPGRAQLRRAAASIAVVGAIVASLTTACTQTAGAPTRQAADLTGVSVTETGPGSVVRATSVPGIDSAIRDTGARVAHVIYRSTSGIDGSGTEVSGTVVGPAEAPLAGGWPIMVLAHGTTGIDEGCAPSRTPDLAGLAGVVVSYLKMGFVVSVPDYQGLGAPGVHPYLDSATAGYNVIDAVRAARIVFPDAGPRWAAFGGSQGGAATWAANELAAERGAGRNLLGTVSLVPAADFSGLVDLAARRRLGADQLAAYTWLLIGAQRSRPGFDIDLYRRGMAARNWDVLSACAGPEGSRRNRVVARIPAADLVPATPAAAARLKEIFSGMGVAHRRASAPMLIYYAGKDEFFDPEWTRAAITRSCRLGSVIESVYQPDATHGSIDGSTYVDWLGRRMAGNRVDNDC